MIVRWMYAPNSSTVDKLLENDIIEGLEPIEEIEVRWDSNKLVLFDSLFRSCEVSDKVVLLLQVTSCMIKTYHYHTDEISLIIHSIQQ